MSIEQFTLISINKQTKEREEMTYFTNPELLQVLHSQIPLYLNEYNYYLKIDTIDNHYILFNDDIFSNCLSIYKKINSEEDLKQLINYSYREIEEVEEEIKLYEEEQERLRQEEEQELTINEDIIDIE